jgi:hypothetical protein
MSFTTAYNAAMHQAGGKPRDAAAYLARRLTWDDALRAEAAALLVALMFEPARSEHARVFEVDTGRSLEAFVAQHQPSVQECEP